MAILSDAGGIWEHLQMQAREPLECHKWNFMILEGAQKPRMLIELQRAKHSVHKVSEGNEDSTGN